MACRTALLIAVLGALATPATAQSDAAAVVARAEAHYDADRRGVIATSSTYLQAIDAVIYHQRVRVQRWIVAVDGVPKAAGVTAEDVDGKAVSAADRAAASKNLEAAVLSGNTELRTPLAAKYAGEFRLAEAPCDGCEAGEQAVAFESAIHDQRHFHGALVIDAGGRFRHATLTPYVYPDPRMNAGTMTIRFTDVLDGRRLPAVRSGDYRGRQGPISGTFRFEETFTQRRFDTLDAAVAAMRAP